MNKKIYWERFDSFNAKTADRSITVTSKNTLRLKSAFIDLNELDSYSHAALFFNRSKNSIGIKFVNQNEKGSKFALSKAKIGKGRMISAVSFFKKYDIPATKYAGRKYLPKKLSLRDDLNINEPGFLYVIDLDVPSEE
jgi:hypothetical protein